VGIDESGSLSENVHRSSRYPGNLTLSYEIKTRHRPQTRHGAMSRSAEAPSNNKSEDQPASGSNPSPIMSGALNPALISLGSWSRMAVHNASW